MYHIRNEVSNHIILINLEKKKVMKHDDVGKLFDILKSIPHGENENIQSHRRSRIPKIFHSMTLP